MEHDLVRRVAWSAILTAFGALASLLATRVAAIAYRRIFKEEPPD